MTPKQELAALSLNPFEGDRDVVYRVLRDGFVTTRYVDECMTCFGPVRPGERIRTRVEKYEGRVHTFRFCLDCCEAMAASWDDNGEAWCKRAEIGVKRAVSIPARLSRVSGKGERR